MPFEYSPAPWTAPNDSRSFSHRINDRNGIPIADVFMDQGAPENRINFFLMLHAPEIAEALIALRSRLGNSNGPFSDILWGDATEKADKVLTQLALEIQALTAEAT